MRPCWPTERERFVLAISIDVIEHTWLGSPAATTIEPTLESLIQEGEESGKNASG